MIIPNNEILEAIGWNRNSRYVRSEFPTKELTKKTIEQGFISHVVGYIHSLEEYYSSNFNMHTYPQNFSKKFISI